MVRFGGGDGVSRLWTAPMLKTVPTPRPRHSFEVQLPSHVFGNNELNSRLLGTGFRLRLFQHLMYSKSVSHAVSSFIQTQIRVTDTVRKLSAFNSNGLVFSKDATANQLLSVSHGWFVRTPRQQNLDRNLRGKPTANHLCTNDMWLCAIP